ncbi:hypothetical protein TUM22923_05740 [Polynucleobacter sp. TUM22923]|jgi:DNA-directed RNA polymerase sigma subunit (sigma70/sigma32)|uniref:sigma factor-like helix-turn-helix DNA-binding protein n=1 Tax=Polynucleobacter sp. TUM22923 TaxID=3022126 RepID=UPI002572C0B8|nr:sigma factor-like helix-turn-helix DNA-binding protein [Polynucleobacter sp. TUM22923]BDX21253.1 hypothetical protein TUM22923_05740 [Polynucleobacter sp. TUM22923]
MKTQIGLNSKSVSALDSLTLKEVGEVMGVTRERIRQVEVKALIKLRKKLGLRNIRCMNQIL